MLFKVVLLSFDYLCVIYSFTKWKEIHSYNNFNIQPTWGQSQKQDQSSEQFHFGRKRETHDVRGWLHTDTWLISQYLKRFYQESFHFLIHLTPGRWWRVSWPNKMINCYKHLQVRKVCIYNDTEEVMHSPATSVSISEQYLVRHAFRIALILYYINSTRFCKHSFETSVYVSITQLWKICQLHIMLQSWQTQRALLLL